jgi:hypothetical protein
MSLVIVSSWMANMINFHHMLGAKNPTGWQVSLRQYHLFKWRKIFIAKEIQYRSLQREHIATTKRLKHIGDLWTQGRTYLWQVLTMNHKAKRGHLLMLDTDNASRATHKIELWTFTCKIAIKLILHSSRTIKHHIKMEVVLWH